MKITIKEIESPMFTEFTMMADPDMNVLLDSKTINVTASHETKTRINTSMQIGNSRTTVNLPIEGFKTHESREHSYFTGNVDVKNYFVKSKKQDVEAYKEYVEQVIEVVIREYFKLELDEVTILLDVNKF